MNVKRMIKRFAIGITVILMLGLGTVLMLAANGKLHAIKYHPVTQRIIIFFYPGIPDAETLNEYYEIKGFPPAVMDFLQSKDLRFIRSDLLSYGLEYDDVEFTALYVDNDEYCLDDMCLAAILKFKDKKLEEFVMRYVERPYGYYFDDTEIPGWVCEYTFEICIRKERE